MDLKWLLDLTDAALEIALALFLLGGAGLALACVILGADQRGVNRTKKGSPES